MGRDASWGAQVEEGAEGSVCVLGNESQAEGAGTAQGGQGEVEGSLGEGLAEHEQSGESSAGEEWVIFCYFAEFGDCGDALVSHESVLCHRTEQRVDGFDVPLRREQVALKGDDELRAAGRNRRWACLIMQMFTHIFTVSCVRVQRGFFFRLFP